MWIMNKAVFAELRKAKDGAGNYYLAYGKGITSGFEWQLLGKPVYVPENMPEPTAAGNIPVLYGDFAGMAMKISQNLEIQLMREKYIERGARAGNSRIMLTKKFKFVTRDIASANFLDLVTLRWSL